jgi:hypothetical protein
VHALCGVGCRLLGMCWAEAGWQQSRLGQPCADAVMCDGVRMRQRVKSSQVLERSSTGCFVLYDSCVCCLRWCCAASASAALGY